MTQAAAAVLDHLTPLMKRHLELLFAGYLHQDWRYEYDSWQQAVAAFVDDYPRETAQVIDEIDALLARELDSVELAQAVLALGAAYDPEATGQNYPAWVSEVRRFVASRASPSRGTDE